MWYELIADGISIEEINSNLTLLIYGRIRNMGSAVEYKFPDAHQQNSRYSVTEYKIMQIMINLVESGQSDNLYKKVASIMDLDEEEIIEMVSSIKDKMKKRVNTEKDDELEIV